VARVLVDGGEDVLEADDAVSENAEPGLVEGRVVVEHAPQPLVQRLGEPDAVADACGARGAAQRVAGAEEILGDGVRADREPGVAQEGADHLEVALHFLLVDLLQRRVAALGVRRRAAEPGVFDRGLRRRLGRRLPHWRQLDQCRDVLRFAREIDSRQHERRFG